MKVYIVGAFDRFNYGDILFPKVLVKHLRTDRDGALDIILVGLVQADLRAAGGDEIIPLHQCLNRITESDVIIIAGGEVSAADIGTLYFFIRDSNIFYLFAKLLEKFSLGIITRRILKWVLKVDMDYPLMPDKSRVGCRVFFNAIGGGDIPECLISSVANADYFSTRSEQLYLRLRSGDRMSHKLERSVNLYPDCAIVLSDIYHKADIESKVSASTLGKIKARANGFLCFQCNLRYYNIYREDLIEALNHVYLELRWPIVFLPIGLAPRHNDGKALLALQKRIRAPSTLISSVNIYDIMYTIVESGIFVGTSLHGVITATSYSVPSIGLIENSSRGKVGDYLGLWGRGRESPVTSRPIDIVRNVKQALSSWSPDEEGLLKQKTLAYENLDNIKRLVYRNLI